MLVSIEMAYVLLLGEECSDKYLVYLVYAHLSRLGYDLRKHKHICSIADGNSESDSIQKNLTKQIVTDIECYQWHDNVVDVDQPSEIKVVLKDSETITSTNTNEDFEMETKPIVKYPRLEENLMKSNADNNSTKAKNEAEELNSSSSICSSKSIINLKVSKDSYYTIYHREFEKFNLTRLKSYRPTVKLPDRHIGIQHEGSMLQQEDCNYLDITFDMYLCSRKHSRNGTFPHFHVVVMASEKKLLLTQQIYHCRECKPNAIPILLAIVNAQNKLQLLIIHCN